MQPYSACYLGGGGGVLAPPRDRGWWRCGGGGGRNDLAAASVGGRLPRDVASGDAAAAHVARGVLAGLAQVIDAVAARFGPRVVLFALLIHLHAARLI